MMGQLREMVLHEREALAGEKPKTMPALKDPLLSSHNADVLELDELWSCVQFKGQTLRRWVALCRHTHQIVAWSLEDRSGEPAADRRTALSKDYRQRTTHPQRSLESLRGGLSPAHPPLLRQARK